MRPRPYLTGDRFGTFQQSLGTETRATSARQSPHLPRRVAEILIASPEGWRYGLGMQPPQFSVPIRDLDRSDQRRQFELSPQWLDDALAQSEARSVGSPGSLEVALHKNGREVLVKGVARARVTMPCARTLEPVPVDLEAEILLLLTPRAAAAAGAVGAAANKRDRRRREATEAEEQLSAELAARDEYEGENIELDGFVREHLLLELPLFPVRSDLPFDPTPATDPPPDEAKEAVVDPRLAPLAALARQLQRTREE